MSGCCSRKSTIKEIKKRIIHVLKTDPGITNAQLKIRFGDRREIFRELRKKLGVSAPSSEYITSSELKDANTTEDLANGAILFGKR